MNMKKNLLYAFIAFLATSLCSYGQITETVVGQGKVAGSLENDLGYFRAIPYAEAPVGDLRWKAPVPKKPWSGTFSATEEGPRPYQQVRTAPGRPGPKVSEDCLHVNVITPAKSADEKLPVLAWIHGGGFAGGGAAENNGINFAKNGIVYVSIEYRTGALGFLALPELSAENERGISGNYGLMDMILGLKWIQDNIAAFGGDPDKVTIMGESAGGIAVSMLCSSPLAKGLFRGAISESGGSFCPVDSVRTNNNGIRDMKGAEAYGVEFMKRIGASSLAELRAMDPSAWVNDGPSTAVGGLWPTVDGYVLPTDQYTMYSEGDYNDVNCLIGTNSDEGAMFVRPVSLADYQAEIRRDYGPFADRMLEMYPASSDDETHAALSDIFRETAFAWPTYIWARLQQQTGKGKIYMYYFDQFNENGGFPGPDGQRRVPRGAGHAAEMQYVFGTPWRPFTPEDQKVSDAMHAYWCNFIKYGDPNGEGLDNWPVYDEGTESVMFFKNGTSLIETPNKPQLDLMEAFYTWKRNEWKRHEESSAL